MKRTMETLPSPEKIALALAGEEMSPSLGSAERFLLVSEGEGEAFFPLETPGKKIPHLLQQQKVTLLICSGIGNCTAELLALMGIRVIPGVTGHRDEVLEKYFSGTLEAGENFTCSENGRSCGECPGYF